MINYLSFYVPPNKELYRNVIPASNTKVEYLIEAFNKSGCDVEMFSACLSKAGKQCDETVTEGGNIYHLLKSNFSKSRFVRYFVRRCFKYKLYKTLMNNLNDRDIVVVYHSMFYLNIVKKLKKKIGFKLILEIEEIYADVTGDKRKRKKEIEYFKIADGYLFSTELLNESINTQNKPYAVNYGTYRSEKQLTERFNDGLIHCVYAGTLDPQKGGKAAVKAAQYLTGRYHLHILGFGSDSQVDSINELISEISAKSECRITYEGLKHGDDYLRFLQSCHIGLSTQDPSAEFNNTSFPSKILSYLSNGLRVVSVNIPAISGSKIGNFLVYYNNQEPKEIADAIMSVDIDCDYNSRQLITDVEKDFLESMKHLICSMYCSDNYTRERVGD